MADEQSEILSDTAKRSELSLVARAARERWPIPEQTRQDLVEKLTTIALGKGHSARIQLAAARALIAADRLNAEGERDEAGGLFTELAEHCAGAGHTVQELMHELRAQPGYVRIAQEFVFAGYSEHAGG